MCLGRKLSDRSLQRYKAKGKKTGYIRVWKVVDDTGKKYRPESQWGRDDIRLYQAGLTRARKNAYDEDELIHAFRSKTSAKEWADPGQVIVEAIVHPDWAMAVGLSPPKKTLTTKAIVMPEYPKRKVTVREFRAAIKGKKVQKYVWE